MLTFQPLNWQRRVGVKIASNAGDGINHAQASMAPKQGPEWLEELLEPVRLYRVAGARRTDQCRGYRWEYAPRDAVPGVRTAKQRFGTSPVATIADRYIAVRAKSAEFLAEVA